MNKFQLALPLLCACWCFFVSPTLYAEKQYTETDWLQAVPGFIDTKSGAEVYAVEKLDKENLTRIRISLPANKDKKIEEVIVRGKRGGSEYSEPLEKRVEVIKDLEQGKTGIVVHVGGDKPFKLLINYIDYTENPGQF